MALYKTMIASDPNGELDFLMATSDDRLDLQLKVSINAESADLMFPEDGISELRFRNCKLESSGEVVSVCFMTIEADESQNDDIALIFDILHPAEDQFQTSKPDEIRKAIRALAKALNLIPG